MEEIKKKARDEFDGFLKGTFPEFAPHLIDTDENAGERFREKLDSIINLAVSKERERLLEGLDKVQKYTGGSSVEPKDIRVKLVDITNLINTK